MLKLLPVSDEPLTTTEQPELNSAEIRARVLQARAVQVERFKDMQDVFCNA